MKDALKKILEKVDPEIFNEQVQNDLVALIESKIKDAKEQALSEATDILENDHGNKLEQILEKIDSDHSSKLQQLYEALDSDHSAKLQHLVEHIDSEHTAKLQKLVEKIDDDHSTKFQEAISAIDSDHAKKLQMVIEYYENRFENAIVEKVSDYLDTYLEEVLPKKEEIDIARFHKMEESIRKIRETLLINDDFVWGEVGEAIKEAKEIIDQKDKEINKLMLEKVQLTKKMRLNEAAKLLESKTKDMPKTQKLFLENFFEDASVDEITQKFDEAVKAYKSEQHEKREQLIEKNSTKGTVVEVPSTDKIEETITESSEQHSDIMDTYVSRINASIHARK